jgi:putative tricarboxylic transport membrane protein
MFAGLVLGMLPGLGGVAAVSILLPFIYTMDQYAGMAMLLGAISIVYTSDTITSVLVGAPGSPASAPTAIEGHALAKQGQAARALGVAYLASAVGGLMGALILTMAIPVAGPLVLALGTPELFMLAVVGLYYASSLVGSQPVKGLVAGLFGVFLGTIGPAPAVAEFRFTFSQPYLLDGLSLVILALGLFGVVEALSMLARGGGISHERYKIEGWGEALRDFVRHIWLVLRSAVIGVFGGLVPAVGASASTWVAYAHAVRTAKDKSKFGRGDIRGIASSEGANNATIISDLVPTMLFSVPGGPAAAIFMGALFIYGYYPGPRFVTGHPDVMFLIIWSCAIASILGALICFAVTPWIARLSNIRFVLVAAPLLIIMVLGAYQATEHIGDILLLAVLGMVGWLMKRGGWPRAPVLVGFVLSTPMEQYFWLTTKLHGTAFLTRPGVILIALLIILPLVLRLVRNLRERGADALRPEKALAADPAPAVTPGEQESGGVSTALSVLMVILLGLALWHATGFRGDGRLLPLIALIPGFAMAVLALIGDVSTKTWQRTDTSLPTLIPQQLAQFGLLCGYILGVWLFGFGAATAVYILGILLIRSGVRAVVAVPYAVMVYVGALQLADLMNLLLPRGALLHLF